MEAILIKVLLNIEKLGGLLTFSVIWWRTRTRRFAAEARMPCYALFSKNQLKKVVRTPPFFNWAIGLSYSVLQLLTLPILVWRYGVVVAMLLAIPPAALPSLCTAAYNYMYPTGSLDPGVSWLFESIIGSILWGTIGIWLASNDSFLAKRQLRNKGWEHHGEIEAPDKNIALLLADTKLTSELSNSVQNFPD